MIVVPIGLVLLFIVAGLVYFGLAHRVLDRMRLTDTQALVILGLMVAGSFIDIPVTGGRSPVSVNVGGGLIPLGLAAYLLARADSGWERIRALLAAVAVAAAVRLIARLTVFEPPQADFLDPMWLFAIIAGVVGYLAGRSRRAAFVAGTLGILLADLVHVIQVSLARTPSATSFGGAGVFDSVVVAGFIAVLLAELVGESRERLQGGPTIAQGRPEALYTDGGPAEAVEDAGASPPSGSDQKEGENS